MNLRIYESTNGTEELTMAPENEEEDNRRYTCRRNHFTASFSKAKESNQIFTIKSGDHRITVLAKMDDRNATDSENGISNQNIIASVNSTNNKSSTNSKKGIVQKKTRKEKKSKKKDVLIFTEVKSGTDYEYPLAGYGIKENIIEKEKADEYSYSVILQCEHVTPQVVESEKRIVFLSNDTGEEIFFIQVPFTTDAKGEVPTDVSYELTTKTTGVFQLHR